MNDGEKVKLVRSYFKLTQAQFAKKIGVKLITVGSWESGAHNVSIKSQGKICATFGIDPEYFDKNIEVNDFKNFKQYIIRNGETTDELINYLSEISERLEKIEKSINKIMEAMRGS